MNTPTTKFELIFQGALVSTSDNINYRRFHLTFESAKENAMAILVTIVDRQKHPATIYGPGCGPDGIIIR